MVYSVLRNKKKKKKKDIYNSRNQLHLGKGKDQLLGGRETLPVLFNLQIATKFRITFKEWVIQVQGLRVCKQRGSAACALLVSVGLGSYSQSRQL